MAACKAYNLKARVLTNDKRVYYMIKCQNDQKNVNMNYFSYFFNTKMRVIDTLIEFIKFRVKCSEVISIYILVIKIKLIM